MLGFLRRPRSGGGSTSRTHTQLPLRTRTPPPTASDGPELATLARYTIVFASACAGVLHLSAAQAHREHAVIFAFFVATGMAQILWGGVVLGRRRTPLLLEAGALGNAAVIAVWVASRTAGLGFVEGAEHREPIGVKDTITVIFEVLVVLGAYVLFARGRSPAMRTRVPRRTLAPLATAGALLLVPGVVVPAHHHSHEHDPGHAHARPGHVEHAEGDAHSHDEVLAAHGHGTVAGVHDGAGRGEHAHGAPTTDVHSNSHGEAAPPSPAARPSPPKKVEGIRASVTYGPFLLPPASYGGEAHQSRVLTGVAKPCADCYVLSARPDLVYGDGASANLNTGVMLHHAVWTRPSVPDTTCGRNSAIGSQGMRFFASGNERTELRLPAGFGYLVGQDPWNLIVEIMNHSEEPKAVYITLDVLYRPASDEVNPVTPVWLDVDNCRDSEYSVPAGKSHTVWTWTSTLTGRVVSTGGHVHNGGVKTVLTNETTHQEMCTSVAGYGTKPEFEGSIESMSTCTWDRLGTVRKGEELGLHAYYDSPKPQDDVMGIMMAFVYETTDLSGGSPPPESSPPEESEPPHHGEHDH